MEKFAPQISKILDFDHYIISESDPYHVIYVSYILYSYGLEIVIIDVLSKEVNKIKM